ncbi:MAG: tol-pal system protein YbgF [Desulfovibrionaceae bacterium]|jgi:tol-pal system protein YbgF|nr:tol-pal system protein YbgF [Desulfovibrionaceae bacterium]
MTPVPLPHAPRCARFRARAPFALLSCLALLLCLGCVQQDDIHALQLQIDSQQRQIKDLHAELQANQAQITELRPAQANQYAEVESLRVEIARLNGELDELNRTANTAAVDRSETSKTMKGMREELDRNNLLWQEAAAILALDLDVAPTKATFLANATQINGFSWAVSATSMNATDNNATGQNATANATSPANAGVLAAAQAATVAKPTVNPADALYTQALESFKAREYEKAQRIWQEFTETFKKHPLMANALFWQGECFYQMRDYARAVLAYQKVIESYPNNSKYPAALLKQGISFQRLGRDKAGRLLLEDVVKKFPQSAEAKRAKELLEK